MFFFTTQGTTHPLMSVSIDMSADDYGHLYPAPRLSALLLSMNIRCWHELVQYGPVHVGVDRRGRITSDGAAHIQRYPPLLRRRPLICESRNISTEIDLEQIPS